MSYANSVIPSAASSKESSTLFVSGLYSLDELELNMALAALREVCDYGVEMNALGMLVCSYSSDREIELMSLLIEFPCLGWHFTMQVLSN